MYGHLFVFSALFVFSNGFDIVFLTYGPIEARHEKLAPEEHKHVQILVVAQLWLHPPIASLIYKGAQASQRRKRVATVKTRESLSQLQLPCEDGFGCRQGVCWDIVTVAGVRASRVSIRVLHCSEDLYTHRRIVMMFLYARLAI